MRPSFPHLSALALLGNAACGSSGQGTDLAQVVAESAFTEAGVDGSLGNPAKYTDPFVGAAAFVATTGPSSHNAGTACFAAPCHAASGSGGAPNLLFGGTVYTDYNGTKAAPGVEVRVVDGQGTGVSVFTGPEGNFYLFTAAAKGLSFPLVVGARNATSTRPMITTLDANAGSCGQKTCHVPGGGLAATGNYYPIHVP